MDKIHTRCIPQGDRFSILEINPRLALCYQALKTPGKGKRMDKIQCAYFGFQSQEDAQKFARYLKQQYIPFAPRLVVREPERLIECGWEVKVWEFEHLLEIVIRCANKQEQEAS